MEKMDCPSCGARLSVTAHQLTNACEYCGLSVRLDQTQVQINVDEISQKLSDIEQAHRDHTRQLQLSTRLSTLQGQLSDTRSEIRALRQGRSKQTDPQLRQLRARENQLLNEIAVIQSELDPSPNQPNEVGKVGMINSPIRGRSSALLLAIVTGFFGGHRFYTGHIGIGIIQFLTFGGFFIWQIIDIISILFGSFKDADGRPLDPSKPIANDLWKLVGTIFGGFLLSGFLLDTFGDSPIWLLVGSGLAYVLFYQKPIERIKKIISDRSK